MRAGNILRRKFGNEKLRYDFYLNIFDVILKYARLYFMQRNGYFSDWTISAEYGLIKASFVVRNNKVWDFIYSLSWNQVNQQLYFVHIWYGYVELDVFTEMKNIVYRCLSRYYQYRVRHYHSL